MPKYIIQNFTSHIVKVKHLTLMEIPLHGICFTSHIVKVKRDYSLYSKSIQTLYIPHS